MMKKLALPLSLLAIATLAACGNQQVRTESADSTVYVTPVTGSTVRAGRGRVAVLMDPTGPVDGISWQRMAVRMDDGSMQILDRRGHQVAMGSTVRVRTDGTIAPDRKVIRATP
jgi:ABC-type uncharacterized transport system auxiliary subunit